MGANVADVTDSTFEAEVLKNDLPVVVDFWAEWCGPCRMIAPVIDEIAAQYGDKVKVVKVNTDENPKVSRDYQIMSIPNVSVFQNGELVKSIIGARPKAAFLNELQQFIA